MGDFLQKLIKVVRIVLYGPTISQSDCKKAGLYQLPFNNIFLLTDLLIYTGEYKAQGQARRYARPKGGHYEGRELWIPLYRYASQLVRSLLPD